MPAVVKKTNDAISKAASQSKGIAKVNIHRNRNGPREKLKKKLIMLSFWIALHMIRSLPVSPKPENTFPPHLSSKNSKLLDPSQGPSSKNVCRTDPLDQLRLTANRPSTPPLWSLRRQ